MTQAVMVTERNGYYQIVGDTVEDWGEIKRQVDRVTFIENLLGWAPYTKAYRVGAGQDTWTYFVSEDTRQGAPND